MSGPIVGMLRLVTMGSSAQHCPGGKAVNWTSCLVPAFSGLAEDSQFGQLAGAKGLVCGCGIRPNELG